MVSFPKREALEFILKPIGYIPYNQRDYLGSPAREPNMILYTTIMPLIISFVKSIL